MQFDNEMDYGLWLCSVCGLMWVTTWRALYHLIIRPLAPSL